MASPVGPSEFTQRDHMSEGSEHVFRRIDAARKARCQKTDAEVLSPEERFPRKCVGVYLPHGVFWCHEAD